MKKRKAANTRQKFVTLSKMPQTTVNFLFEALESFSGLALPGFHRRLSEEVSPHAFLDWSRTSLAWRQAEENS